MLSVVYEKTWPCSDYPDDGKVTFFEIYAECDGKECTKDITWQSKVKDDNCGMKANVLSPTSISITWDTSLPSRYDNHTREELHALNRRGWAKDFPFRG